MIYYYTQMVYADMHAAATYWYGCLLELLILKVSRYTKLQYAIATYILCFANIYYEKDCSTIFSSENCA